MKMDRRLRVQLSDTASVSSTMGKEMWNEKKKIALRFSTVAKYGSISKQNSP